MQLPAAFTHRRGKKHQKQPKFYIPEKSSEKVTIRTNKHV